MYLLSQNNPLSLHNIHTMYNAFHTSQQTTCTWCWNKHKVTNSGLLFNRNPTNPTPSKNTHPPKQKVCTKAKNKRLRFRSPTKIEVFATKMKCKSGVGKNDTSFIWRDIDQCFSTCVRPRHGIFFFHKTRARSQQIYS
jgi:hypothetical protein